MPPLSETCSPASGSLALAVQLVASVHLHDPRGLQRARDYLSAAGFDNSDDIIAAVDREAESVHDASPILTAAEAQTSGLFSPFVKGYAAVLPSVIGYSHGMLAHAHSSSSISRGEETAVDDLSDLSLSAAAAPVRAAHPERPDRLRAAGI
jgi:hypothetical protein